MQEAEAIESIRQSRKENVRFFSNVGKSEREIWIAQEFLKVLSISFSESEFISQIESSDVDVIFRDANFQIKELTEPDCRRHAEVSDDLKRAASAKKLSELFAPPVVKNVGEYEDAYPLIQDFADNARYATSKAKLDLLVYVTHRRVFLNRAKQPANFSTLGWRSISCLFGPHAYVLVAADNAPNFLKSQVLKK